MHVHATNGTTEHAHKRVHLFPFVEGGTWEGRDRVRGWIKKIHVPICSQ
jgi:hypothetical protein